MTPTCSTGAQSDVSKHQKSTMCLREKNTLCYIFHVGVSYRAVGHESTIWYSQKEEEEIRQSIHEVALESAKITCIMCEEALEKGLTLWIHEMTINKKSMVKAL